MPATNRKAQGIFISYRRTGTRADAGRLYDRLTTHFGRDHVFMDIDDIEPGQNFQQVLQETLANCQVLLVLIGPKWLHARDEEGSIRLEDKQDFVRLEVESALQRELPVIPILINRAVMPGRDELPPGIDALADHQALEVSDKGFHEDVDNLIQTLDRILASDNNPRFPPYFRRLALGLTILSLALVLLWFTLPNWWPQRGSQQQGSEQQRPDAIPVNGIGLNLRHQPARLSRADLAVMLVAKNFFDASLNPSGTGLDSRYKLNVIKGDRVIIDHATGLMWQQPEPISQHTFADAWLEIHKLNKNKLAGYGDWRLPTLEEAMSILVPVKQANTHLSLLFSPQKASVFWTADEDLYKNIWVIYAYGGVAEAESSEFNAWTRAVRVMR